MTSIVEKQAENGERVDLRDTAGSQLARTPCLWVLALMLMAFGVTAHAAPPNKGASDAEPATLDFEKLETIMVYYPGGGIDLPPGTWQIHGANMSLSATDAMCQSSLLVRKEIPGDGNNRSAYLLSLAAQHGGSSAVAVTYDKPIVISADGLAGERFIFALPTWPQTSACYARGALILTPVE